MITSSSMVIASSFADIVAERRDSLDPAAIMNRKKIQLDQMQYFMSLLHPLILLSI